jgi:hypothetical protein
MGILNSLFGGGGQQPTTQPLPQLQNTSLAQQLGNALWMTTTYNPHMQQINATALHNPSTWEMVVPLEEQIKELRYILKRTVENYDELQAQYKALQDITKAEENK